MQSIVSTDAALLSVESDHIHDFVHDWLTEHSESTRLSYQKDILYFAQWLSAPSPSEAVRLLLCGGHARANELVRKYKQYLVERGLAPATINRRLASLRSVVSLARSLGMIEWTLEVRGKKVQRYRDTRGPGVEAVQQMLFVAAEQGGTKALRDTSILLFLFVLGLRRNEITTCDVEHFDRTNHRLSILGKGREQREWITVPVSVATVLEAYLAARKASNDEPLVQNFDRARKGSRDRGRLSSGGLYRNVRQLAKKAKIPGIVSPHRIRHTAITAALDVTGGDVREARHFSRHSRVDTLLVYDDARQDLGGKIAEMLASVVEVNPADRS